jgi:hypothetical protein
MMPSDSLEPDASSSNLERYCGVVLSTVLLCGCATTPSPKACFQDASDGVGWKPIRNPPYHADEMRKLAHQNRANDQLPHRPEYWFSYFDGRVMLCEPIKHGSCGATITFFAQDESGAMVISNPGLDIMCVSHLR